MPIDDALLKSFSEQTRSMVLQSLLLKLHILVAKLIDPRLSIDESTQLTLQALESTAVEVERIYLQHESFSALTSEERALLADETRAVVDSIKEHASFVGTILKQKREENG